MRLGNRVFGCQLGTGIYTQRAGCIFFSVIAALSIEDCIGRYMQQARSAPGDMARQLAGNFSIQLGGPFRVGFTGFQVCQGSTVNNPVGLRLIQQALDGARSQQVGGQNREGIGMQRVAVCQPKNSMFLGGFQRQVDPEQAAGSRNQDATALLFGFHGW